MVRLLLFGPAAEYAGRRSDDIDGGTVEELVRTAVARYGAPFSDLLPTCRIWVNGEESARGRPVDTDDEVAIIPPMSGG